MLMFILVAPPKSCYAPIGFLCANLVAEKRETWKGAQQRPRIGWVFCFHFLLRLGLLLTVTFRVEAQA